MIAPLVAALRDLVTWLQAESVPGVVIGGVAASVLGPPRMTNDVDALVALDESRWEGFVAAGRQQGFVARAEDWLAFAKESRVLLMRHGPSATNVEVVVAGLSYEQEVIERAQWVELAEVRLPLPTPEDLVIMKSVAHRPRDVADIEGIVAAREDLDWDRVLSWAKQFAEVLARSEIYTDLAALHARVVNRE